MKIKKFQEGNMIPQGQEMMQEQIDPALLQQLVQAQGNGAPPVSDHSFADEQEMITAKYDQLIMPLEKELEKAAKKIENIKKELEENPSDEIKKNELSRLESKVSSLEQQIDAYEQQEAQEVAQLRGRVEQVGDAIDENKAENPEQYDMNEEEVASNETVQNMEENESQMEQIDPAMLQQLMQGQPQMMQLGGNPFQWNQDNKKNNFNVDDYLKNYIGFETNINPDEQWHPIDTNYSKGSEFESMSEPPVVEDFDETAKAWYEEQNPSAITQPLTAKEKLNVFFNKLKPYSVPLTDLQQIGLRAADIISNDDRQRHEALLNFNLGQNPYNRDKYEAEMNNRDAIKAIKENARLKEIDAERQASAASASYQPASIFQKFAINTALNKNLTDTKEKINADMLSALGQQQNINNDNMLKINTLRNQFDIDSIMYRNNMLNKYYDAQNRLSGYKRKLAYNIADLSSDIYQNYKDKKMYEDLVNEEKFNTELWGMISSVNPQASMEDKIQMYRAAQKKQKSKTEQK